VVLETGEVHELTAPEGIGQPMPGMWSLNSEHVIVWVQGEGYKRFDLETGEPVAMAAIDPGSVSGTSLAPDGKTVAALVGTIAGPTEAVVYDVATGEELFRRPFEMSIEGDEISWDGTTLAVGSYYGNPVTVIDIATGDEHTLDAHGVVV
jgi:hypothetical protein